ncbi:apolipoprotein N-acyltransferase [bacterium]|nr:apolipoprotein N-acyltransferase [bacterium]
MSKGTADQAQTGAAPLDPAQGRLATLKGWRALAVAALFGAVANLAFAPLYIWPAWAVGAVGLIWLLDGGARLPAGRAAFFWRTFAFGFSYFLIGLHWTAAAFLVDARQYLGFVWMAVLLLPGGLAFIWALFFAFARGFWSPGPARILVFVVAVSAAEWTRSHLFGGLPWNLPGMVWVPGSAVSQSASVWGATGLSILTVFALASPATLANVGRSGAIAAAPILVSAILFGALWGWGAQRLSSAGPVGQEGGGPVVRIIDAGVPQRDKFQPGSAWEVLRRYHELTGPPAAGAAPIVIWPEGALPAFLFEWPEGLDVVTSSLGDRRLILGVTRREIDPEGPGERAYNSLAVLSSTSSMRGALAIYDKHRLVPFGEFTPLRSLAAQVGIPTLQALAVNGFYSGPRPTTMSVSGVPPFGPLICYEAIFPGLAPDGDDRPNWLVVVSNDSWFGQISGPRQHAAQSQWRAIEEGLPVARAASGGPSGMIDPFGRWTARAGPVDPAIHGPDPKSWRAALVDAPIPAALPETIYSRWGDLAFWLFFGGFTLGVLVLRQRKA